MHNLNVLTQILNCLKKENMKIVTSNVGMIAQQTAITVGHVIKDARQGGRAQEHSNKIVTHQPWLMIIKQNQLFSNGR